MCSTNLLYYQQFQRTTVSSNFSEVAYFLGICRELAEVGQAVYHNQKKDNIVEELGDYLWYLVGIMTHFDFPLLEIIQTSTCYRHTELLNRDVVFRE